MNALTSIYDFQVNTINGDLIEMSIFRGKVLLIVNTASRCSYSRQFAGLQKLYEIYKERGLEILAFPCNQFNGKEPGSSSDVREYCERSFGVTFPLMEKMEVRGPGMHPLFQFLTEQAPFQGFNTETSDGQKMQNFLQEKYPDLYAGDGIKWNFTKFVIDRNGQLCGRYEAAAEPFEIEPIIKSLTPAWAYRTDCADYDSGKRNSFEVPVPPVKSVDLSAADAAVIGKEEDEDEFCEE